MERWVRYNPIGLLTCTILLVCVVSGAVRAAAGADYAGTFYQYAENPRYWQYVDAEFGVEVLVPSRATSYVEQETFGEIILRIALSEGPTMLFGRLPSPAGGAETIKGTLVERWRVLLENRSITNDQTIETGAGEEALFTSLEGERPGGRGGMIRLVVFSQGEKAAYLLLLTDAEEYNAVTSQYWIRAVNSFRWRWR